MVDERFTGLKDGLWAAGQMPLPKTVNSVSHLSCLAAGLDPSWAPFVEVQMTHAIARANELPPGTHTLPPASEPLEGRVPDSWRDAAELWTVTRSDTVGNAHYLYRYRSASAVPEERKLSDASLRKHAATARTSLTGAAALQPQAPSDSAVRAVESVRSHHR